MAKLERIVYVVLRFIAFGTTLSATIIMASSHDTIGFLTFSFQVKYTDSPAFVYFVIANAVVSVYGFLVLFLPSESLLWRLVVALDLVFTILLTSSISAALAIAQVGKKGNSNAGWLPVCGQVSKYCDQVTAALATGSIAVTIYMVFVLHSIHTVLDPLLLRKT